MQTNIEEEGAYRPEFTGALSMCFCFKHGNGEINLYKYKYMVCWFRELNNAQEPWF